ncbi:MAG: stage II sporulation protein M [Nitrospirae bacterium]|nr:stage II sporulation protein M [Nitrospirota bacterium]
MKKRYQELGGFIGQSAKYIYAAMTLFSVGILIGYINPDTFKGFLLAFGKMAKGLLHQNMYGLILSIFVKNSISALISILLGAVLGIVPSLAAITNGILIGATIASITKPNAEIELLRLLPHGIFELPAVFAEKIGTHPNLDRRNQNKHLLRHSWE